MAEVLIQTLSAPALKTLFISFKFLIPPPTVIGINTSLIVLEIISEENFFDTNLQQYLDRIIHQHLVHSIILQNLLAFLEL